MHVGSGKTDSAVIPEYPQKLTILHPIIDFPYEKRFPGYVKGFVRRFWQGSIDHRGTPDSPGRVVTLVPYEEWERRHKDKDPHGPKDLAHAICWGVAYKIAADKVDEVLAHLDHREKNGYDCVFTDVFHPSVTENGIPRAVVKARVYIATSDNESFLGPTEIEKLALQIATSKGPSGHNAECMCDCAFRSLVSSSMRCSHSCAFQISWG